MPHLHHKECVVLIALHSSMSRYFSVNAHDFGLPACCLLHPLVKSFGSHIHRHIPNTQHACAPKQNNKQAMHCPHARSTEDEAVTCFTSADQVYGPPARSLIGNPCGLSHTCTRPRVQFFPRQTTTNPTPQTGEILNDEALLSTCFLLDFAIR